MRRVIATLMLSLMLLQAIPVLHFFSLQKAVFYAYIDEEKPEQKLKLDKEEKEFLTSLEKIFVPESSVPVYFSFAEYQPSSPLLEFTAPPPDACWSLSRV